MTSRCWLGYRTFQNTKDRPTLIIVDSHIGYGAPNKQDTSGAHGEPLGEDEIRLAKRNYGWPEDKKFYVPRECTSISVKGSDNGARNCATHGSHKLVNIANSTRNLRKNYSACSTVSFPKIGTAVLIPRERAWRANLSESAERFGEKCVEEEKQARQEELGEPRKLNTKGNRQKERAARNKRRRWTRETRELGKVKRTVKGWRLPGMSWLRDTTAGFENLFDFNVYALCGDGC